MRQAHNHNIEIAIDIYIQMIEQSYSNVVPTLTMLQFE